jgi:hypothetical protein
MTMITAEHKAAFREARQAALDTITKLNALLVETDRPYRAALRFERELPPADPWDDDDDDVDDDDVDSDQRSGIGREVAEGEDEAGA